jgi:hypothetical protein
MILHFARMILHYAYDHWAFDFTLGRMILHYAYDLTLGRMIFHCAYDFAFGAYDFTLCLWFYIWHIWFYITRMILHFACMDEMNYCHFLFWCLASHAISETEHFARHGPAFMAAIFLYEVGLSKVIHRWIRIDLSSISRTGNEGSTDAPWPSNRHMNALERDFTVQTWKVQMEKCRL